MFLVFLTQEEAQAANLQIIANIRNYLEQYIPNRVHPDGLISTDIDGNPVPGVTITNNWGDPIEYQEGWAIAKPTQEEVGRVPLAVALTGVGGTELASVTAIADTLPA